MTPEEQYKICKEHFDRSDENDKAILTKLEELNNHLFVDNDGECLQSKVNANRRMIKIVTGVFSAIATTVLGVIGWIVRSRFSD